MYFHVETDEAEEQLLMKTYLVLQLLVQTPGDYSSANYKVNKLKKKPNKQTLSHIWKASYVCEVEYT